MGLYRDRSWIAIWSQRLALVCSGIITIYQAVPDNWASLHNNDFRYYVSDCEFTVVLSCSIVILVSTTLAKLFARSIKIEILRVLFDEFQAALFGLLDDDRHLHRVTLYQYKKSWYVIGKRRVVGKLVPRFRSGHLTQNNIKSWSITDDANEPNGMAGKAWGYIQNEVATKVLNPPTRLEDKDAIEKYARDTNDTRENVEQRILDGKSLPAFIVSFRISLKPGETWGVVVIDSRKNADFRLTKAPGTTVTYPSTRRIFEHVLCAVLRENKL